MSLYTVRQYENCWTAQLRPQMGSAEVRLPTNVLMLLKNILQLSILLCMIYCLLKKETNFLSVSEELSKDLRGSKKHFILS